MYMEESREKDMEMMNDNQQSESSGWQGNSTTQTILMDTYFACAIFTSVAAMSTLKFDRKKTAKKHRNRQKKSVFVMKSLENEANQAKTQNGLM